MATLEQRTLDPHQCTCKGNTSQLALVIHRLGIRNSDYQQFMLTHDGFEIRGWEFTLEWNPKKVTRNAWCYLCYFKAEYVDFHYCIVLSHKSCFLLLFNKKK